MRQATTEIRILLGNIVEIERVDAIVNAANKTLLGGGGVDGAIHKAAGWQLRKECLSLHGCKTGEAKLTKGYKLPCKYVIHTVGPVWKGGTRGEHALLSSCYGESLRVALENGIKSIAFPSISTGAYGFPVEDAAHVALTTTKEFTANHRDAFDEILFVLFDEETKAVYAREALRLGSSDGLAG